MALITRTSGLNIEIPEGFVLKETGSAYSGTRATRHTPGTPLGEAEAPPQLIEALADQDMQLLDSVTIDVVPEFAGRLRKAHPEHRTVEMSVTDISADEGAVILIEQDGVYSWHLPTEAAEKSGARRITETENGIHFTITLEQPAENEEEFKKRGFVSDFIVGQVRAYVLKFIVKWGTGKLMTYLERNIQKGLVNMSSPDPSHWSPVGNLDELGFPSDRPARILLFLHGTFSSTLGSYGALGGTKAGRELLKHARNSYDAIIGFDHPTLSLTPEENARELLDALQACTWMTPPHLDIVSFSRGGLVYRALSEVLLPKATWRPHIDRVVFVAVPNAGTHLAEPDNWHTFLDLYTNLAAAASKILEKFPHFSIPAKVFNELIQGLGALGKYLATQAVTKGDIPGLAAMEPDGPFISDINLTQENQPTVDTTFYCAVTSEFETGIFDDQAVPKEFSKRLVMTLVDRVADQLFDLPNDLVVDTASMTAIDKGEGQFIKEQYDFGRNSQVYHTVYFAQPAVAQALGRWLKLDDPDAEATRSGSGDWVPSGSIADPVLPPEVETGILVTSSGEAVDALRDDLENSPESRFVIVRHARDDRMLNYTYSRNEIDELSRSVKGSAPLKDVLDLHKSKASRTFGPPLPGMRPTIEEPAVILDNDLPVGVILPEAEELLRADAHDLQEEMFPEEEVHVSMRRSFRDDAKEEAAFEDEAASEEEPASIQCHFYAEMPGEVKLGEDATLLVSVSRELIQAAADKVTAGGTAAIDPERNIILDVRARENFIVVGMPRAEIEPPAPDDQKDVFFTVRATDLDEGEIWVTARQGQFPLVTLKLRVKIMEKQPGTVLPASVSASTDEPPVLPSAMCQLRIFERRNGEEISYEYDLDIPGVVFDRYESPAIRTDRNQYINELYKEIEARWLSSQKDMDAFNEEMREMGGSLFKQLFPSDLQHALWDNRDAIAHIQVISTEPFIPWEIVHLTEPGEPLPDESLFLAQCGLVRWLHGSYYPNRVHIRKGRAYYVIPDYQERGLKLSGTVYEKEYLEEKFEAAPVEPHPLPVRKILRGPGSFDLLHFAGHGIADQGNIAESRILLEGRVEEHKAIREYLSSTAVEQQSRLKSTDGNQPMVVLNACQTGRIGFRLTGMGGFASAFLSRGAGIFVSTLWSVYDEPAKDFVLKLYDELCDGAQLADAVIKAREAARLAGDASWLSYVVYGNPNARIVLDKHSDTPMEDQGDQP